MDDTCCIPKKCIAEELLDHFNSIQSTIKFTFELKKDRNLAFIDIFSSKRGGWQLAMGIIVYRKPTYTDWYLHF